MLAEARASRQVTIAATSAAGARQSNGSIACTQCLGKRCDRNRRVQHQRVRRDGWACRISSRPPRRPRQLAGAPCEAAGACSRNRAVSLSALALVSGERNRLRGGSGGESCSRLHPIPLPCGRLGPCKRSQVGTSLLRTLTHSSKSAPP
jgi:hypothetical protein